MRAVITIALFVTPIVTAAALIGGQDPATPSTTYSISGATTVTMSPRPDAEYRLYVAVPVGYDEAPSSYPVVYLLDGDWYFALTVSTSRLLEVGGEVPPAIVVGIGYGGTVMSQRQRRWRDFTPAADQALAGSGRANAFLSDLRDAIIPYVQSRYRTNGDRVLIGHSLGGLFALHAMMREPRLFGRVVMGDPAWWPAGGAIWADEQTFRRHSTFQGRAFVALSDLDGRRNPEEMRKLSAMLVGHAGVGFNWVARTLPDTSHQSSVGALVAAGLRWVFAKT